LDGVLHRGTIALFRGGTRRPPTPRLASPPRPGGPHGTKRTRPRAEHADYLAWVRHPANGFASGELALAEDAELSVRVAGPFDGQERLRNPSV